MLKKICIPLFVLLISFAGRAQDIGYTTTDIGGEYQWHSAGGFTTGLHVAFNGVVHSGFQVRVGYNKVDRKEDWGLHKEEVGSGFGGGIGYRYYFPIRPHQFFMGIRSDIWRLKIDWASNLTVGTTKTWTLQPAAEAGYMFLINDMAFITPAISAGYISNIATDGEKVGEGFSFSAGISVGVKF